MIRWPNDLAFLFPGQGSQKAGMEAALNPEFLNRIGEILGFNPFEPDKINLTAYAQPAILAYSIAQLGLQNRTPAFLAGHSLGEYSALVAGGVLSFEKALQAVHYRGKFMQEAVPIGEGAMIVVLDQPFEELEALCKQCPDYVAVANYNGPGQTVLSGTVAGIEAIRKQVKRTLPLSVSAPFHCALMKPAQEKLATYFETLEFQDSKIPIISNVISEPVISGTHLKKLLIQQVTKPVQFTKMLTCLRKLGTQEFLEIGPGRILTNLIKRMP